MTKYQVTVRRDAWVNYVATVEADSPQAAASLAERAWKLGSTSVKFEETDMTEFDNILVDPDEVKEVEHP